MTVFLAGLAGLLPWSMNEGGVNSVLAALLANLGVAMAKLVGFVATGSAAMLA